MINRARMVGCRAKIFFALAVATCAGAWAAPEPRPFLLADVDGDGKKDAFFRTFMPDRRVEIGVKLTKNHSKYEKIYDDEQKDFRESVFGILDRKSFLADIKVGCVDENGCPDYRLEAISMLEKSISPVVVNVAYDFSAKVLCIDENGQIVEVWYSD